MKKSIIIPFLIIPFVLASCSDENKQITIPTSQNISSGSTQTLPKANTGTLAQSGIIQAVAVSTGSVEVVKTLPTRTLVIKKYNIFLMEDGKEIAQLTKKGNTDEKNSRNPCLDGAEKSYSYKLYTSDDGGYGLARRTESICGMDFGGGAPKTVYAINLKDGSDELTEIKLQMPTDVISVKIIASKATIMLSGEEVAEANPEEFNPYSVPPSEMKDAGYVKSGKNYTKTIDLAKAIGISPVKAKVVELKKEPIKQETTETTTKTVPLAEGTYAIKLKSEYGSDLSSSMTIKKTGIDIYSVDWSWLEEGYQEGNPDSSRNDGGRGVLKMKGGSGILTLTEWDEESTCATFSVSVKNNTLSVSRSGRPGMCSFNEGTYTKK